VVLGGKPPEYAQAEVHPVGRQMLRWKSDPLIVLCARESRVHGEAAGRVSSLFWGHMVFTQRKGSHVNETG